MRYLQVRNDKVVNIAVFDVAPAEDSGWVPASAETQLGWVRKPGGGFKGPQRPPKPPRTKREIKHQEIAAVKHSLGDGRSIPARQSDLSTIRDSIDAMEAGSVETTGWLMSDGSKSPVTVNELKDALAAGQAELLRILDEYEPE